MTRDKYFWSLVPSCEWVKTHPHTNNQQSSFHHGFMLRVQESVLAINSRDSAMGGNIIHFKPDKPDDFKKASVVWNYCAFKVGWRSSWKTWRGWKLGRVYSMVNMKINNSKCNKNHYTLFIYLLLRIGPLMKPKMCPSLTWLDCLLGWMWLDLPNVHKVWWNGWRMDGLRMVWIGKMEFLKD